ncbi:MAG: RNA polymerase sigma factor [Candidatus Acidiferrum sp.]
MQATTETVDAGTLFRSHHERIYRYVLHLVGNAAEAEDLTQETFLRAHSHLESLREKGAVLSWLYRIATHVSLDRLRQRKPQISLDGDGCADGIEPLASVSPSALDAAERKETSRCVQRCLQFLPDKYRVIIVLHEIYNLTAAEIASVLQVNLTTAKMRLHRARAMLEMVMECGCAVSNDACGLPVCQEKPKVPSGSIRRTKRKK